MYVGGLLADLPVGRETQDFLGALVGALLLSACLAGLAALVSALTDPARARRRGGDRGAARLLHRGRHHSGDLARDRQRDRRRGGRRVLAVHAVQRPQVFVFDAQEGTPTPPSSDAMGVFYLVAAAVTILGTIGLMLLRYRKVQG